jgi:hypothetical protein
VQKIITHVETLRHTSKSRVDEVFLYYPNVFLHCVSLRLSSQH